VNAVLSHGLSRLAARLSDLKTRLRVVFATELAGHVAAAVHEVVQAVLDDPRGPATSHRRSAGSWDQNRWDDDPWEQGPDPWGDDREDHDFDPPAREDRTRRVDPSASTRTRTFGVRLVDWWRSRRYGFLSLVGVAVGLVGLVSQPVFHATLAVLVGTAELLSSAASRTATT
jgi:hypothetical protein